MKPLDHTECTISASIGHSAGDEQFHMVVEAGAFEIMHIRRRKPDTTHLRRNLFDLSDYQGTAAGFPTHPEYLVTGERHVVHGSLSMVRAAASIASAVFGAQRFQPCQAGVRLGAMLGQVRLAGLGEGEGALGALRRRRFDQALLLQHRQCRIDDSGAWHVGAAGARLQLADQVVAMAGLRFHQQQQH